MPSRVCASEKVRRDEQIVHDRARGLTWPTIAERHGLSPRQCQNVVAEHLAAQRGGADEDAAVRVDELLMQLDAAAEEFALAAAECSEVGEAVLELVLDGVAGGTSPSDGAYNDQERRKAGRSR